MASKSIFFSVCVNIGLVIGSRCCRVTTSRFLSHFWWKLLYEFYTLIFCHFDSSNHCLRQWHTQFNHICNKFTRGLNSAIIFSFHIVSLQPAGLRWRTTTTPMSTWPACLRMWRKKSSLSEWTNTDSSSTTRGHGSPKWNSIRMLMAPTKGMDCVVISRWGW